MDTVTLGHSVTTVEDCEDNWTAIVTPGANTATLDNSDYQRGAGSVRLGVHADATAPGNIAYEDVSNIDISALDSVSVWVKTTTALNADDFALVFDNDPALASIDKTLNLPAISANAWTRVTWTGQTLSGLTSVSSVGIRMLVDKGAITSFWVDDIIAFKSKAFNIYAIKGLDDAEHIYRWPAYKRRLLDGSHVLKTSQYGRVVSVQLAPIAAEADRYWLSDALSVNNSVRILYASDEVEGVDSLDEEHELEWLQGLDFVQGATLTFYEKKPIWSSTRRPPSWA